ncbi:hypothetical protein L7F22_020445 [Adiantum nelumboides]|nr:hypothetical protein [Adiantum nelumboides]
MLPHEASEPHQPLLRVTADRSMRNLVFKLKKAVGLSSHHCGNGCFPFLCRQPSCTEKAMRAPPGFVAVYAGRELKRFVIPTVYLNHPAFLLILEKAKQEFGFSQKGGIKVPFEVLLFEQFLWLVGHADPVPRDAGVEELERYYQEKHHLSMETIHFDD